ncbi:MAG: CsbD family protein [Blastocatellales bacterium]
MWNKDEVEGKGKQIKGAVKEKLGELTNNPALEEEGELENAEGHLQQTMGKARRKAEEAAEIVKRKVAGQ